MEVTCRLHAHLRQLRLLPNNLYNLQVRLSNTLANETLEKHRRSRLNPTQEKINKPTITAPRDYRYVYPDFLPNPDLYKRDRVAQLLERQDMIKRRRNIDIPEFYVGSILSVTVSDPYAPGKKNTFVGLCIERGEYGLRSFFVLRNVVDGQGVEIRYEMYNPTLQRLIVLKLEKRLDESLYYLRDAPSQYSTVPFNMEPVPHPPGAPVPVNPIEVPLNPPPWHERWERHDLRGAVLPPISERRRVKREKHRTPWEKYDLMKIYRATQRPDEVEEAMADVHTALRKRSQQRERH